MGWIWKENERVSRTFYENFLVNLQVISNISKVTHAFNLRADKDPQKFTCNLPSKF